MTVMRCYYLFVCAVVVVAAVFIGNCQVFGLPVSKLPIFFGENLDLSSETTSKKAECLYNIKGWEKMDNILTEPFDEEEHIASRIASGNTKRQTTGLDQSDPSGTLTQGSSAVPSGPIPTANTDEVFCDFGPLPVQSLCEWQNGCGILKWATGTGMTSNWLGGPSTDSTAGTVEGGFAFLETSQSLGKSTTDSNSLNPNGVLHSPQLGSTGVLGTCLMFKYAIDGLSSAGLKVRMHVGYDELSSTASKLNDTKPASMICDATPKSSSSQSAQAHTNEHVIWNAHYHILGVWQQAQILYTFPDLHTLIIEGMPVDNSDPSRSYRGYIAIDDIDLQPGTACMGFCNFAGGFCEWTNDAEDDFDWSISRGSNNPTTGPVIDRGASERLSTGGYAYIDSSFPRRPGDIARLTSVGLPATAQDAPMCMHFSFHMFGSGIGELRILLRHARNLEAQLQEIWRLKGNAGNSWFDSRVTISSSDDFQLLFEATVGNTAMGDIAIDEISFTIGSCPTSPQVAAPTNFPRDCSFEIDECEWIKTRESNAKVASSQSSRSRVDWERVSQQTATPRIQRKSYSLPSRHPRQEYFMALQTRGVAVAVTDTAYFHSNEIKGSNEALCLTFWYLMFESFIDATGPSLGVLRVLLQPVGESLDAAQPVWQLYNNQGPTWSYGQASIVERRNFNVVFEGTWGPNRANGNIAIDDIAFYMGNCTVRPSSAAVRAEDCSFEKGLCGWENVTNGGVNDPRMQWQRAFPNHRPAQLLDKTFGSSGDFIFFDIFSPTQKREVRLRSPMVDVLSEDEITCFTFWFVAFGVEESTSLRIIKLSMDQKDNDSAEMLEDEESIQQVLWSLTAKGFNNPRPSWTWAQVAIESRSPFRLILEGSASNGGFAIDDIKFQSQLCPTRPVGAKPSSTSQEL